MVSSNALSLKPFVVSSIALCGMVLAFTFWAPLLKAGVEAPQDLFREACVVCRGTVLSTESFRDPVGRLQTRTFVRVEERFKGRFPAVVQLVHAGGFDGLRGLQWGHDPRFRPGEERLLFLNRRSNGTLYCRTGGGSAVRLYDPAQASRGRGIIHPVLLAVRACAVPPEGEPEVDVTDQAASVSPALAGSEFVQPPPSTTGLEIDGNGISSRFVASDRGEVIPYRVDAAALPAGVTLEQALGFVRSAFDAWSAATSLTFEFEGVEEFGRAASDIEAIDGRIRIQLHDLYGVIPAPSVLGIGGRAYLSSGNAANTWGKGGAVAGVEFHQSVSGFVVMGHLNASLRNPATFTESLCHEIGHVLSLAHSSENPFETNSRLRDAMMYYAAHADGRGARLSDYDLATIRQVAPPGNTPPFSYDRIIDAVTQPGGVPNISGINEIEALGYDLQSPQVTFQSALPTSDNGSFVMTGTRVRFNPRGFFQGPRIDDLASGEAYDRVYVRHFDGTNASAYATIRVVSFSRDQNRDGVPDAWIQSFFPGGGANAAASADPDRDGFTNLQEYMLGSNPVQASSNLRILSIDSDRVEFQANPYHLYEIHGSFDGLVFQRRYPPVIALSSQGVLSRYQLPGRTHQMLRVVKVP